MTREEKQICKAPPGKYQLVQMDPRDNWPTRAGKPTTLKKIKQMLGGMLQCQREVMQVFNDKGKRVTV